MAAEVVVPAGRVKRGAVRGGMFELEQFVADCRAALAEDASHVLVREVVKRAVADPASFAPEHEWQAACLAGLANSRRASDPA